MIHLNNLNTNSSIIAPRYKSNKVLHRLFSSCQLNAHFLYSITIYMLHYNPQHVSSSTLLIFRKTNCIITVSGIVTLCKRPYRTPVEGGLGPFSTCLLFLDFLTVNMRAVGSLETSVTSVTCQKTTICSDNEIWKVWGSHRCRWGFWNVMLCNWVISSRRFERIVFSWAVWQLKSWRYILSKRRELITEQHSVVHENTCLSQFKSHNL